MRILSLAFKSLDSRKYTVTLTLIAIAISVLLLLGVLRLKSSVEEGFTNTISGTDLVVGSRTGEEQLVLASIFHIGELKNEVSWDSYQQFDSNPLVNWTIPISLGDSHKGFKVIGTGNTFFEHYQYAGKKSLALALGHNFEDLFDVVIGADVAQSENYEIGGEIDIQHGSGEIGTHEHEDHHFIISGILERTGTPVDKSIFIDLKAFEGIHLSYIDGVKDENLRFSSEELRELELVPQKISAFLVGLNSKRDVLSLQSEINRYKDEPLTAASPAFTLVNLWSIMGNVETVLFVISIFVVIIGLISMLLVLFAGIRERRREMAIFRSMGASIRHIYALILGESLLISIGGVLLGAILMALSTFFVSPLLESKYGIMLRTGWSFNTQELLILFLVILAGSLIGIIPAYRMHQLSLKDGLSIKL